MATFDHLHTGKAVSAMCFSPCFIQATRGAFVQRQLLQCRTCGSQAFQVLDCCRNPDYARVPASPVGKKLWDWLGRVQAMIQSWLPQPPACQEQRMSPEALDAWEVRPIVIVNNGDAGASRRIDPDQGSRDMEHETASAHR